MGAVLFGAAFGIFAIFAVIVGAKSEKRMKDIFRNDNK